MHTIRTDESRIRAFATEADAAPVRQMFLDAGVGVSEYKRNGYGETFFWAGGTYVIVCVERANEVLRILTHGQMNGVKGVGYGVR